MLPSIFRRDFMDDLMEFPFRDLSRDLLLRDSGIRDAMSMRADLKESDAGYDMCIDLPGFKKDQIKIEMDNGYLCVSAERRDEKDEKDENGKFLHRERSYGSVCRRFYFGSDINEDEIKAKFEDGVLKLSLPKTAPVLPEKKQILIGD